MYNYFKNVTEENMSHKFKLEKVHETRDYLFEKINQNELMSQKQNMVFRTINYIEHFLILGTTITGCISISAFASLVGIPVGITSSSIGLKICAKTEAISRYKSIIKKRKKITIK